MIAALHNHELMIRLNPHAIDVDRIETAETGLSEAKADFPALSWTASVATYRVNQNIPMYGRVSLLAVFHDESNGTDCIVEAPLGLQISTKWRVLPQLGADGQKTGRMVLEENCKIHASKLLLPLMPTFILPSIKKSHAVTHEKLIEQVEVDTFLEGTQS